MRLEEKFDELVNDGLAAFGPLDQKDVILPSVFERVVACIHWQENEC